MTPRARLPMATPDASLAWPAGEKGTVLLDVVLDKPVDEAFMLIFGGENELRASAADLRPPLTMKNMTFD